MRMKEQKNSLKSNKTKLKGKWKIIKNGKPRILRIRPFTNPAEIKRFPSTKN